MTYIQFNFGQSTKTYFLLFDLFYSDIYLEKKTQSQGIIFEIFVLVEIKALHLGLALDSMTPKGV